MKFDTKLFSRADLHAIFPHLHGDVAVNFVRRLLKKDGMMPEVAASRRLLSVASPSLRKAALIARDAAEILAEERFGSRQGSLYFRIAERLTEALESHHATHPRLLSASPSLIERSGQVKTLLEMIEAEPDDDSSRIRLAKLLIRALNWNPDSLPKIPA